MAAGKNSKISKIMSLMIGIALPIIFILVAFFYDISTLLVPLLLIMIYVVLYEVQLESNQIKLDGRFFWIGSIIGTFGFVIYSEVGSYLMYLETVKYGTGLIPDALFFVYGAIVFITPFILVNTLALIFFGRRGADGKDLRHPKWGFRYGYGMAAFIISAIGFSAWYFYWLITAPVPPFFSYMPGPIFPVSFWDAAIICTAVFILIGFVAGDLKKGD